MLDKRMLKEGKKLKRYIPLSIVSAVFNACFTVASAYLLSSIVNFVFIEKKDSEDILNYAMWFLANAAAKALVNLIIETRIRNMSEDIKEGIRTDIFETILHGNPLKIRSVKSGEIVNSLTEGVEMISPYFSQYIPQLFGSVLTPLILCVAVFIADRWSGLIMLLTYPIIPVFMRLIGYKSKEASERQWNKLSQLSAHFLEMLQGLSTLKVFGRSRLQEEKVYETSENYRKSTMDVLRISFLSALVLELSATISTAIIAVNLGLRLVYSKIDFWNAFFVLVLAPDFYLPLRQLGLKFHASMNGQAAMDKINELRTTLEEKEEACVSSVLGDGIRIEVKNLSYSHQDREAIHGISFSINSGEKVALIGESGSGKSTLINILCKLLEVPRGTVFVNGMDIVDIKREEYLKRLAIVPQFPHMFQKSIEDNIALGFKKNTDEMRKVTKASRIDSFSEEYQEGLHTVIGEGEEIALSGGEKQRIAISRALYKASDFIILDEPTSAMDSETEGLLSKVVEDFFVGKTVLLSAHRLSTIKNVDRILVMKDGQIIESGTTTELLQCKGYYYDIVETANAAWAGCNDRGRSL